jgi:hypothetical protein
MARRSPLASWTVVPVLILLGKVLRFAASLISFAVFPGAFQSRRFFIDPREFLIYIVGLNNFG